MNFLEKFRWYTVSCETNFFFRFLHNFFATIFTSEKCKFSPAKFFSFRVELCTFSGGVEPSTVLIYDPLKEMHHPRQIKMACWLTRFVHPLAIQSYFEQYSSVFWSVVSTTTFLFDSSISSRCTQPFNSCGGQWLTYDLSIYAVHVQTYMGYFVAFFVALFRSCTS